MLHPNFSAISVSGLIISCLPFCLISCFTWYQSYIFNIKWIIYTLSFLQHNLQIHIVLLTCTRTPYKYQNERWTTPIHILIWSFFSFQIAFFNGGYVFPLLLICGMYSVMLRRLWRQAPGGHASAESIRNKKRVIRMVLIVIVIFALSWLPIQVVLVLRWVRLICIQFVARPRKKGLLAKVRKLL